MIQKIKQKINDTIINFRKYPFDFDNNEWQCYTACKRVIQDYEKENKVFFKPNEYHEYIEHISNKLGI